MTIPHWEEDSEAWDRLILGKTILPGIWKVEFSLKREIDKKKAKGVDGARFKDLGYLPAELTFTGQFISAADWKAMQTAMDAIHPRTAGGVRNPLSIEHPKTRFAKIDTVYITEVDAPDLDERGVLTISIRALQWVPQPKKAKTDDTPVTVSGLSIHDNPPPPLDQFPGTAIPLEG
jgi:hypothetical protein